MGRIHNRNQLIGDITDNTFGYSFGWIGCLWMLLKGIHQIRVQRPYRVPRMRGTLPNPRLFLVFRDLLFLCV